VRAELVITTVHLPLFHREMVDMSGSSRSTIRQQDIDVNKWERMVLDPTASDTSSVDVERSWR